MAKSTVPNSFAHIELSTTDVKKAKKFYQSIFSWKLRDMPGMPYTMIDTGEGSGGGMQNLPMPEAPIGWLPYVQVDDVKATLLKVKAGGGAVILNYHPIGEMGAIGVFTDPTGAGLGIWEAGPGAPAANQPPKKKTKAKKASKKAAKKAPKKAAKKASK